MQCEQYMYVLNKEYLMMSKTNNSDKKMLSTSQYI